MNIKSIDELFKKYELNGIINGCSTGSDWFGSGEKFESLSPVDGKLIGTIKSGSKSDFDQIIKNSKKAFKVFRRPHDGSRTGAAPAARLPQRSRGPVRDRDAGPAAAQALHLA